MNERIARIANYAIENDIYPPVTPVEYDREDIFLGEAEMVAKRVSEYLAGQKAVIGPDELLIGRMHFDNSVTSEYYARLGHPHYGELIKYFYVRPVDRLLVFDWIHSGADFSFVLKHGIQGYRDKIRETLPKYQDDPEKTEFLLALDTLAQGLVAWANRCADACIKEANAERTSVERRTELLKLAGICRRVPEKPAGSFYEAVQCCWFIFSFLPDSPGRLDQYLYPYYEKDLQEGRITQEFAFSLIQEYLINVFGHQSYRNHRSGDNHFCVGGYKADGTDGYNPLSALIMEALADLPIWRPQISFRWTQYTTLDTMRYVVALNRRCMNIVLVNDEPRVSAFVKAGIPFEDAVQYTTVGCNEAQIPGLGKFNSGISANIGRSMVVMLHQHGDRVCQAQTFEELYSIYEEYLFEDLREIMEYNDKFSRKRAKDMSLLGSLLNQGCIEKATRLNAGGGKYNVSALSVDGIISCGDSLSIIKQFVYDEKIVTMEELIQALKDNWAGHEELHTQILKHGRFYGNDDDYADDMLCRIVDSIDRYCEDKRSVFGGKYLFGSYIGYNPSNAYFAALLEATPDGRYSGEAFGIGMGQLDCKDHVGLTALLKSAAKVDYSKFAGPVVLNIKLDARLADTDEKLDKLAQLFHTYFKLGGLQFQPTYISTEELLKAQQEPEKYKNLRVRVSGFSGNFTMLAPEIQQDVIRRTDHGSL